MTVYHPIIGLFSHGDTVTITIIDSTVPASPITVVNGVGCTEIGSTGWFSYITSIEPSTKNYIYTMTNGTPVLDNIGVLDPLENISVDAPTVEEIRTEMDTNSTKLAHLDRDITDIPSAPTVDDIDTKLSTVHGSGRWDRVAGSGLTLKEYTQNYNGNPLPDCEIWVSTDLSLSNVIASGLTDALGKVYLYPDVPTGTTLYFWRRKTGYTFTNPDLEVM